MKNLRELQGLENLRFTRVSIEGIGDAYSYIDTIRSKFGVLVWARDVFIVEFRQLGQETQDVGVFRVEFREKKEVISFLTPFVRGTFAAYLTKRPKIELPV